MSKFLVKNPDDCVKDFLKGVKASYPRLCIDVDSQIILLNKDRGERVAILSGGGSGHEPFGAGFVGENMLTGFVAGPVFAAPPPRAISKAIINLANKNKGGVLVLIMNYTGDILNFGIAIEQIRSRRITDIETVVIGDDCVHLVSKENNSIGRRGLSGVALVSKIVGTIASFIVNVQQLAEEARLVNNHLFTIGVGIKPCTLPGQKEPLWKLQEDELEIGVGVHGEKGIRTEKMYETAELVKVLVDEMAKVAKRHVNDTFVVLINNLGTCTDLEMFIIAQEAKLQIEKWMVYVKRLYVGKLMSSINMKGFQICILNVTKRDYWITMLDSRTDAFAWTFTELNVPPKEPEENDLLSDSEIDIPQFDGMVLDSNQALTFKKALIGAATALESKESQINELDSGGGDGDCGSCLKRLSVGVKDLVEKNEKCLSNVSNAFFELSKIAETYMGGTSGALYSLLLLGAAENATSWESAWQGALNLVMKYTKANVGSRTMLDALIPAFEAYQICMLNKEENHWQEALRQALFHAKLGCQKTSSMDAKFGRASYVSSSVINNVDPGAFGVVTWLEAIHDYLLSENSNDDK